jgi:hypothetical protein
MDTGLRRYDGTESRYRCADHRCTYVFEGRTKSTKVRRLSLLRDKWSFANFAPFAFYAAILLFGCGSVRYAFCG